MTLRERRGGEGKKGDKGNGERGGSGGRTERKKRGGGMGREMESGREVRTGIERDGEAREGDGDSESE